MGEENQTPYDASWLTTLQSKYAQPMDITSQPLSFQPAATTNHFDIGMGNILSGSPSSEAMQGGIGNPPRNQAQGGEIKSNAMQEAHDAVMDLMKGGKAIPKGMVEPEAGSGKVSGLNLSQYNRVERDVAGNIIGLSGRMQVDPISGASTSKIAPDWQSKGMGVSETDPDVKAATMAGHNPADVEAVQNAIRGAAIMNAERKALEQGAGEGVTQETKSYNPKQEAAQIMAPSIKGFETAAEYSNLAANERNARLAETYRAGQGERGFSPISAYYRAQDEKNLEDAAKKATKEGGSELRARSKQIQELPSSATQTKLTTPYGTAIGSAGKIDKRVTKRLYGE